MVNVNKENLDDLILGSGNLVVVDFYADWCGPCRLLSPVLETLDKANENVSFVKVNVDDSPELCSDYGIKNVPTLIFIKEGKELTRTSGAQSETSIQDKINSLL